MLSTNSRCWCATISAKHPKADEGRVQDNVKVSSRVDADKLSKRIWWNSGLLKSRRHEVLLGKRPAPYDNGASFTPLSRHTMIKFEDNHVTMADNLIISDDDPHVSTMLTNAKTYNLTHVRTYYVSGLAKHIALHKAVSFWQRVGFSFKLIFGRWKSN